MFIIKRKDGQYVARPGAVHSYTFRLQSARVYKTLADAERDRCPENEYIITVADEMRNGRGKGR